MRKKERAPPPGVSWWHGIEDRAPDVSLDKIAIVLVEPFAWATIMAHNFQSLANLKVIVERSLVFVLERGKDFGIIPINGCVTILFVCGNARVTPVLHFHCSFVLMSSGNHFPFGLPDVLFVGARA